MSDPIHGHYRTKEEVDQQKLRDPVVTFQRRLEESGLLDDIAWDTMEEEVAAEVEDAVRFADESPDPDPSELTTHVLRES